MFSIINYNPEIIIKLENGLYQFETESSVGKTRLYNVARQYSSAGESIVPYSYMDWKLGVKLDDLVNKKKPSVVIVDRLLWSSFFVTLLAKKYHYSIMKLPLLHVG